MTGKQILATLGAVVLVLTACGPAATATPVPPTATPRVAPTATATPLVGGGLATATPIPQATATPTKPSVAQPKYGGTLRIVRNEEDPSWDFMKYTGGGGNLRPVAHMVFNMLASRASAKPRPCETALSPELAESWKWVNDTTFQVNMRQGVKFQNKSPVNGREVTAEDVAYSYNRGFFTYPVRNIKIVADQVGKVVALDRYTISFQTKTPLAILPDTMATFYSLVVLAKESGGPKETWEDPDTSWIGSGPFVFQQYLPGLKKVLVRNPDYFEKGFPYLDRVEHVVIPDKSTVQAALRGGRVDLWDWNTDQISVDALAKSSPQIQVQKCPATSGTAPGWVYFKADDLTWKDIRVRRAAMMAVDTQSIIDKALLGQGVGMAPWPPVLPTFTKKGDLTTEAQKYLTYNPQESRRLLADAGYSASNPPSINFVATTRYGLVGPFATSIEMLQKMFDDVGFKVKVDWQDSGRYMAGFITGQWTPGYNPGAGLWDASTSAVLTKFSCKAGASDNKAGVCDPEYDNLVSQWLASVDAQKQQQLARAVQSRIIEQAYGIPGAVGFEFALTQPWVKNFTYVQWYYPRPIAYTWLDR